MEQVYIFDFGDKIKAGYSTNVKKRLRTIELSSGVTAKQIYSVQAGRSVEKLLHNKLENRLLGEFFAFPFERAKELLDEIVANYIPPVHGGDAMDITVAEKIRLIMKRQNKTMGDIAEASGQTRQNLSNKMTRGNFTEKDILALAGALGCQVEIRFTLPDGTEI